MSPKRRRSRNIWGAPPSAPKPFDYEETAATSEPEPDAPSDAFFDYEAAADAETPVTAEIDEPEIVQAGFEETQTEALDEQEAEPELEPQNLHAPRSKHLRKRAVVLPRFGAKPGKHSARPEPRPERPSFDELEASTPDALAATNTPDAEPELEATPEPELEATPEPELEATPEPELEATPEPEMEATPEPELKATPEPELKATPEEPGDLVPEEEAFPEVRRRGKHLRKRAVVLPKRSARKPGRHSLRSEDVAEDAPLPLEEEPAGMYEEPEPPPTETELEPPAAEADVDPAPDGSEDIAVPDVSLYEPRSVADLERELDEERTASVEEEAGYRARHVRRKRVVLPGRSRPGKHSVGASPPEMDETALFNDPEEVVETPEEEVPRSEDEVVPGAELEVAPEIDEEIEAFEPPSRDRRKRKKGRHRRPGSGLLPKERSARGRHAIQPAEEPEPEPFIQEPEPEPFIEEPELEQEPQREIEPEPEAEPEVELPAAELVEVDMGSDDEDVVLLDEPASEPEPLPTGELEEVDIGSDFEDVALVDDDLDADEPAALEPDSVEEQDEDELDDDEPDDYDELPDYDDPAEEDLSAFDGFIVSDDEGRSRRRVSRSKRRRRARGARVLIGLFTAVVTAVGTVGAGLALDRGTEGSTSERDRSSTGAAGVATSEGSTTTLVYAVREADEDHGPVWLTLLAHDKDRNKASAIYIPAHLASEIPGRGLLSLSEGWVSGGPSLLLASAENLLGMKIDRYMELSDNDAQVMFDAIGPLSIDVPSEVQVAEGDSGTRVVFDQGPQELSPELMVRLLYTRGLDVDDAELGSRILAFWDALLDRYAGDRAGLAEVISGTGPAIGTDATTEDLAGFFEALASVPAEDVLLASLPVNPIAEGENELYSADLQETSRLLSEALGEVASTEDDARVQILNGNGVPGIGAEVADRLIGEGFRVILSGNARRFDYETTVIVTYDDSEEGQALAERARELLGVGEVQISTQHQGSVDLTIVIGKDFLRAR